MSLNPTTRLAARYPNLAQAADLAFLLQTLAQDIDLVAARYDEGVTGSRPAAGIHGRFYWDTTTSILYYDDGSVWHSVGSIATGSITLAMMGANSVDSSKIVDASIAVGDLAFDPATQAELDAVTLVPSKATGSISGGNNAHVSGAGPALTLSAGHYILFVGVLGSSASGSLALSNGFSIPVPFAGGYEEPTIVNWGGGTLSSTLDVTCGGSGGAASGWILAVRYSN